MWEMESWEMNRDFLKSGYMDIECVKIYPADEPSYPAFNAKLRTTAETPDLPSPNRWLVATISIVAVVGTLVPAAALIALNG